MLKLEVTVEFYDEEGYMIGNGSHVHDHDESSCQSAIEIVSVTIEKNIEIKIRPAYQKRDEDIIDLIGRIADRATTIKLITDWGSGAYCRISEWFVTKTKEDAECDLSLRLTGIPRR